MKGRKSGDEYQDLFYAKLVALPENLELHSRYCMHANELMLPTFFLLLLIDSIINPFATF